MKKVFLVSLMVFGMSFLILGGFVEESKADAIKLTRADFAGMNHSFIRNGALYTKEVEKRTNGRVKIAYYPAGALLKGKESYEGVVKGIADMSVIVMGYTPGRFPLTKAWNIPGPITDPMVGTRIYNEMFEKFKPAELMDTTLMYAFQVPGAHLFNTVRPVKSVNDLKDLKVRCFGVTSTILKVMGATPVSMPAGAQAESLQKGLINATITGSTVKTYKLAPPLKYATLAPMTAAAFLVVMNNKKWNSLPPDIQSIFREINKEWMNKDTQGVIDASEDGLAWAKEHGVEIIEATPEYMAAREKGIQAVYDEYFKETKKRGLNGREFLNEMLRLVKKYQR